MADVVVVGVLQPEVVLLDDVHLVVHLLHQFLPRRFLLQKICVISGQTLSWQKNELASGRGGGGRKMEKKEDRQEEEDGHEKEEEEAGGWKEEGGQEVSVKCQT